MLNHARGSDSTSLVSLHIARRHTKTRIEPGAPSSRKDPVIDITAPPTCFPRLSALLARFNILSPFRVSSLFAEDSVEGNSRFSERRVSSSDLTILLERFPHEMLHLRTYILFLSFFLPSPLSLSPSCYEGPRVKTHATVPCSISHPPPSRRRANHHPNRCRAVCVCTSRERFNVSNPRPNRESN